jgi:hypothetical protein
LPANLGDKVVVSLADGDRVVALDELLTAKLLGKEDETSILSVHVFEPRLECNVLHASDQPPMPVSIPPEGSGPRLSVVRQMLGTSAFSTIWPSASIVFFMISFAC